MLTFGFFWGTVIEAISCVTSSVKVNFFSDVQSFVFVFFFLFWRSFFLILCFVLCPLFAASKGSRGQSRSKTENRLATNVGRGQSSCTALSRKPVPRTAHFSRDRPSCVQSRHHFCGNFQDAYPALWEGNRPNWTRVRTQRSGRRFSTPNPLWEQPLHQRTQH